jgi:hypothetical protein
MRITAVRVNIRKQLEEEYKQVEDGTVVDDKAKEIEEKT